MRILYVEDDPFATDLTRRALLHHAPRARLDAVTRREEALAWLTADPTPDFDVVLTDLRLPDGDGLSLLTEIRDRSIPVAVVVLTGAGNEETAVASLKAGADDYLVKRGDYLDHLPLKLENAIHGRRAEAAKATRRLRVLYAECSEADIDLTIRHFARYAPRIQLEIVRSGPEAARRIGEALNDGGLPDVLLLDYRLPGLDALEVMDEISASRIDMPVIVVTGRGDEDAAVRALKLGLVGYVVKSPGYLHRLPTEVENAYHQTKLAREELALREIEGKYRGVAESASLMAERLSVAQEQERARIANDLHDDLSQRASALTINLATLRHRRRELPVAVLDEIAVLEAKAAALADGIRRVSHELHPAILEHVGLPAALRVLVSELSNIDVRFDLPEGPVVLPNNIELCIYRIVQEALHNAVRHSNTTAATVSLAFTRGALHLTVTDSGTGFDLAEARRRGGLGLISIEERARLVGGMLRIQTRPGGGTAIHVFIPIAETHTATQAASDPIAD